MTFGPYHRQKLPFPSIIIASRNDEFCQFSVAEKSPMTGVLSLLMPAILAILTQRSGHGPWPEGLMVLSQFLAKI